MAYACTCCNRAKGSDVGSIAASGEFTRLFNPRTDRWADHFKLRGVFLDPQTAIGEVTARILGLNDPERIMERQLLARLIAVDREYLKLHQFQAQADDIDNPNDWALICESHAGVIFFGMDSTIEGFVFALNAIGFLKHPGDFCDIADAKALRQIGPKNILGGDPTDRRNPKPGYLKIFPRVVACWQKHNTLLSAIFGYHDVSKQRSAVSTGGNAGVLHVRGDPKQPSSGMSSTAHTLESLAHEFQKFIDELLPIALEEAVAAFGCTTTRKNVGG